jgi:hypothetical protein
VVAGDDQVDNGARRNYTGNAAGKNGDLGDDTERNREGGRFEKLRLLTTNVTERSARHGEARSGRNRGRKPAGVDAVFRRFSAMWSFPASTSR